MADITELEEVVRIIAEHAVRVFHASRGADGRWIDYGVCETCRRLPADERPDLHAARMLDDAGLLASPSSGAAPRPGHTGSSLF